MDSNHIYGFKNIPYTYLIGWSQYDKWYYGRRTSAKCNPAELWVTYFTSSSHVKHFTNQFGDPDVIIVRKCFDSILKCAEWESKVLRRMNVEDSAKFLNRKNGDSAFDMTGWVSVKNAKTGQLCGRVRVDDSRFISGELISASVGIATMMDADGNKVRVDVNDPRVLSGQLKGVAKGTAVKVNIVTGERKRVHVDDPGFTKPLWIGVTLRVFVSPTGEQVKTFIGNPAVKGFVQLPTKQEIRTEQAMISKQSKTPKLLPAVTRTGERLMVDSKDERWKTHDIFTENNARKYTIDVETFWFSKNDPKFKEQLKELQTRRTAFDPATVESFTVPKNDKRVIDGILILASRFKIVCDPITHKEYNKSGWEVFIKRWDKYNTHPSMIPRQRDNTEWRRKFKQTMLQRYGVENAAQIPGARAKQVLKTKPTK